jgi:hypothetical protein
MSKNPFIFEGPLQVSSAATVIILRRAKTPENSSSNVLTVEELSGSGSKPNPMVAGTIGSTFEFESGWEVLMGQNEVIASVVCLRRRVIVCACAGKELDAFFRGQDENDEFPW